MDGQIYVIQTGFYGAGTDYGECSPVRGPNRPDRGRFIFVKFTVGLVPPYSSKIPCRETHPLTLVHANDATLRKEQSSQSNDDLQNLVVLTA